jgi:hypothetical protein
MKKEYWEVLSIVLETAAFFLAAPDFLGDQVLENVETVLDRVLRPLGWIAAKIARWIRGEVTIGWGGPLRRSWQIVIVLLLDAYLLVGWWLNWNPIEAFLKGTIAYNPIAGVTFMVLLNFAMVCYVIEMTAVTITGQANAKGAFFLMGSVAFLVSKSIAILVALEWVGTV